MRSRFRKSFFLSFKVGFYFVIDFNMYLVSGDLNPRAAHLISPKQEGLADVFAEELERDENFCSPTHIRVLGPNSNTTLYHSSPREQVNTYQYDFILVLLSIFMAVFDSFGGKKSIHPHALSIL